jgi:hypothetical protein
MTRKEIVRLAELIRYYNVQNTCMGGRAFDTLQINMLANFCRESNPQFDRNKWLSFIDGKCGPHGGKVKK